MKKLALVAGLVVLLLIVAGASLVGQYNSLVTMETSVDAQWAQVENQLQRRADLIPNLVNTVKGYAAHEKGVFGDIAEARGRLSGARTPQDRMAASNALDGALSRLLLVVENYPQLKADASFNRLMDELSGTENRLAVERMRYNETVANWNREVKKFPLVVFASLTGKAPRPYFEVEKGKKEPPQVNF